MPAFAAPPEAAVFNCLYSNRSPIPTDTRHLKGVRDEFRPLLKAKALFTIVPAAQVEEISAEGPTLRPCNGCAETFARKLDADVASTAKIQAVSNLILNLDVYLKPFKAEAVKKAYSVDLRGDTDESFDRSIRFPVRNNMDGDKSLGHD